MHNQQCENNQVVLGTAYQPHQRRPMDIVCHGLETVRQIIRQAVGRRPGQILEERDMAEDSTRQANLEAAFGMFVDI